MRGLAYILSLAGAFVVLMGVALSFYVYAANDFHSYSRTELTTLLICVGFLGVSLIVAAATLLRRGLSINDVVFNPLSFFPIIYSVYFGFGMFQWTDFLREVKIDQYRYYFDGLYFYYLGVALVILVSTLADKVRGKSVDDFKFARKRAVKFAVLLMAILAILAGTYVLIAGFKYLVRGDFQDSRTEIISSIGGYVYYLALLAIDVVSVLLAWRVYAGSALFNLKIDAVLIAFFTLVLLALGSRTRVIYPFLIAFVFYGLYSKKVKVIYYVYSVMFVVMFLVIYGAIRYVTGVQGEEFGEAISTVLFAEINLASNTFERVADNFPNRFPYVGPVLMAMPFLTLLPGKQQTIGAVLKESFNLDYSGGGFTPTILGSFYLMGGEGYIITGMFFIGALLGMIYFRYIRKSPSFFSVLFYSYICVYFLETLKGGVFKDLEIYFHLSGVYVSFCVSKMLNKSRA